MELLINLPMQSRPRTGAPRQPGAGRFALVASAIFHGALLGAALLLPLPGRPEPPEPMVLVDVIEELPPEQLPLETLPRPEPAPTMPKARRVRVATVPRRPAPVPPSAPVPVPSEAPVAPAEPSPVAVGAAESSEPGPSLVGVSPGPRTDPGPAVGAAGAGEAAGVAGPGGGPGLGRSPEARRGVLMARYLKELFRTRILTGYPEEARELELAGNVVVQVAVDHGGRLLDLRLVGRCPHPILCRDALQKLRGAAPFPPPPPAYGGVVHIDVPFTYSIQ